MNVPSLEVLSLIEYRMRSVTIGHLALRHSRTWYKVPAVRIYFDDKEVIEGKATAFTNGAIEAAIVHCRALLEFLGFGAKSQSKLLERTAPRKADDRGIEHFGGLKRVSVVSAVRSYPGPKQEAEAALAYVCYLANKGLAHTTASFTKHDEGSRLLEIAFQGVPVLLVNNFYVLLGIEPPK